MEREAHVASAAALEGEGTEVIEVVGRRARPMAGADEADRSLSELGAHTVLREPFTLETLLDVMCSAMAARSTSS
jgi:hypothetical protein